MDTYDLRYLQHAAQVDLFHLRWASLFSIDLFFQNTDANIQTFSENKYLAEFKISQRLRRKLLQYI
jgi:hypothetical protein